MKTLKMLVGRDIFALSSFSIQSLFTIHLIWCCCPLIFQMGIILPFIFRYHFCWNKQENCRHENWRIRPLEGKTVRFIPLFQASELSPAEFGKCWGQGQPGLVVSRGRKESCGGQWEVDGSPQVGMEHECLPPRGIPNLCAPLQVLPYHFIGQLLITSLQKQEQKSNLKPAREKEVIILPLITAQLCCNHSNKTKTDKWWLLRGAFNLNKSSINFSYYWQSKLKHISKQAKHKKGIKTKLKSLNLICRECH